MILILGIKECGRSQVYCRSPRDNCPMKDRTFLKLLAISLIKGKIIHMPAGFFFSSERNSKGNYLPCHWMAVIWKKKLILMKFKKKSWRANLTLLAIWHLFTTGSPYFNSSNYLKKVLFFHVILCWEKKNACKVLSPTPCSARDPGGINQWW